MNEDESESISTELFNRAFSTSASGNPAVVFLNEELEVIHRRDRDSEFTDSQELPPCLGNVGIPG